MEVPQSNEKEKTNSFNALVILGGGFASTGELREWSTMRALAAVALTDRAEPFHADILIPSSGYTLGPMHTSEAEAISEIIKTYSQNIQRYMLYEEKISYSTTSNAKEVYKILFRILHSNPQYKALNLYLLTSAYHMKRSKYLFEKYRTKFDPLFKVDIIPIIAENILNSSKLENIHDEYLKLDEKIRSNIWIQFRQTLIEEFSYLLTLTTIGENLLDNLAKYRMRKRSGIIKLHF